MTTNVQEYIHVSGKNRIFLHFSIHALWSPESQQQNLPNPKHKGHAKNILES